MSITLEQANTAVAAALAKASEMKLKPLTVAVLDAGGHLVALQRQDGSSILRPEIAIGKAASSLALGLSSRKIAEMAADRPSFVASLGPLSRQGIIPAAGGLLIFGEGPHPVGAIGVTGDLSDNDEAAALAGVAAAGLKAEPQT